MSDCTDNCIAQVARDWRRLTTQEAADVFQATFHSASVLPNSTVLQVARDQCEASSGPETIALVGCNDEWSVYLVGATWLAVDTECAEAYRLTELPGEVLTTLPIPVEADS